MSTRTTRATMGIRRPAADVFQAFVDPRVTTQFWFTRATGPLEPGASVRWEWEMYGVSDDVTVVAFEPSARLVVEMSGGASVVTWTFEELAPDRTFVTVEHAGFRDAGDDLVAQMMADTEGWTLTLAGAKAWLEHGLRLNLVSDHSRELLRSRDLP